MILPINDSGCGWLNIIEPRTAFARLDKSISCDWLIIGAGYTGLSAARQLAKLRPNDHIIVLEAQQAAEGASARNSGYLVDSTLNDGHLSADDLNQYQQKYDLNLKALKQVKKFVSEYNVDCDWQETGKFHATALEKNKTKLSQFHQTLSDCGISSTVVEGDDLARRLGTNFYRMAVHTQGGVMLQPAKLARAMITALPSNVTLFENSPVRHIQHNDTIVTVTTTNGQVKSHKLLMCTNGFLPSLSIQKDRAFPLSLTASLTRQLTESEYSELGAPDPWGLLSAQAMGATVRLTADKRIMIRNTAEAVYGINLTARDIQKRVSTHQQGLISRFPSLPKDIIEHSWAGVTCVSGNSANIFTQLSKNSWAAGCYNGGGIGLATHFGEQLAFLATGEDSADIQQIMQRPKPNWLPPNPALRWGVKMRLAKDRILAKQER
ncbi:NAD(P)/FAD-dependent oxidoreductase [Reinekea sp.]|jgi:glycine/D-amino acid oxidase-like deaminating enzyme|uniref:NAD(P)/FAD-dependent oxidoreductase n=1 Tax=Reinekea sp. TaxID=1970455 RepID=UPI003988B605